MTAEEKFYSHVQPFDTKFILDFLSNELFVDHGDLKFLSWDDLDRALESDTALKEKLSNIARDKEIYKLKQIANQMTRDVDHEVAFKFFIIIFGPHVGLNYDDDALET